MGVDSFCRLFGQLGRCLADHLGGTALRDFVMGHHFLADGGQDSTQGSGALLLLGGVLLTISAFEALEGEGGGNQGDEEEGEEGGAHHCSCWKNSFTRHS